MIQQPVTIRRRVHQIAPPFPKITSRQLILRTRRVPMAEIQLLIMQHVAVDDKGLERGIWSILIVVGITRIDEVVAVCGGVECDAHCGEPWDEDGAGVEGS